MWRPTRNSDLRQLTVPVSRLLASRFGGVKRRSQAEETRRRGIPASAFTWLTLLPLVLVIFFVAESAAPDDPLCPTDMFAYLPLDDTTAPPFLDRLAVHDGACGSSACPSYTASGVVAGAQSFSAPANTGINIPAHSDFDFGANTSFSVEYWMMTPATRAPVPETRWPSVVTTRVKLQLHWWTGCLSPGGGRVF